MKKNVIIAGYPKSGTTWLTRLTAEVIGCPVAGFWGEPEGVEIAVEGEDRNSPFRCFKAHHQPHELETHSEKTYTSVIYIVRDPRDVIVSGSRYFYPPRFGIIRRVARTIPYFGDAFKALLNTQEYRISRMMKAVLEGDKKVNHWCRVDWETHVSGYLDSGHLVVRYEDLLSDATRVCREIASHLGLERSESNLEECVYRQSMEVKKQKFLKHGEEGKADFMKSGTHGKWKDVLSRSDIRTVNQRLNSVLERLGYEYSTQ